jgi:hypothetical protein
VLADVPLNEINPVPEWPFWWPSLMKFQNLGVIIPQDEPYPELKVLEELARPQIRQQVGQLLPETARMPYGCGKGAERAAKRWLNLLNTTSARDDIRFRQVSAADLSQIAVRTLAIYGMESKWRSSGEILRDCLPNVELVNIENAGHAHPWQRPEIFYHQLLRFLAESDRLAPQLTQDRRKYQRLPLEMPVQLRRLGGIYYSARTLNVSNNGLLLTCPQTLEHGSEIEVVATLNQNDLTLNIPGIIVREEKDASGASSCVGVELLWQDRCHEAWEELLTSR